MTIALKNVLNKQSNYDAWYEYENSQLLLDNEVFGDYKYVALSHQGRNHLVTVNYTQENLRTKIKI